MPEPNARRAMCSCSSTPTSSCIATPSLASAPPSTRMPGWTAVFGSYDDEPADEGTVSAFRNLLHHHVHQSSPGPAEDILGRARRDPQGRLPRHRRLRQRVSRSLDRGRGAWVAPHRRRPPNRAGPRDPGQAPEGLDPAGHDPLRRPQPRRPLADAAPHSRTRVHDPEPALAPPCERARKRRPRGGRGRAALPRVSCRRSRC